MGVALYNYKANPDSPGGFEEMDLHQGEQRIYRIDIFMGKVNYGHERFQCEMKLRAKVKGNVYDVIIRHNLLF